MPVKHAFHAAREHGRRPDKGKCKHFGLNPTLPPPCRTTWCIMVVGSGEVPKLLSHSSASLHPSLGLPRLQNSLSIATPIDHCKLGYCNSLYSNLPKSQITRLQQIQNSLARAVVKAPKFCHITPILHSLHWLKITEHIEYKILMVSRVACDWTVINDHD